MLIINIFHPFHPIAEVLSPHRPPAPPTEYFQFNVGGYDTANLLRANAASNTTLAELQGFIGCVRGLQIGDNLIDLAAIAEGNIAHGESSFVRLLMKD